MTGNELRGIVTADEERARTEIAEAVEGSADEFWDALADCDALAASLWAARREAEDVQLIAATDCFYWALHLLLVGWRDVERGYFVAALRHSRGIYEGLEEGLAASVAADRAEYWASRGADHAKARKVIVNRHYRELRGRARAQEVGEQLDQLYEWGSDWDHVNRSLERHMMTPEDAPGERQVFWRAVPDVEQAEGIATQYVELAKGLRATISEATRLLKAR